MKLRRTFTHTLTGILCILVFAAPLPLHAQGPADAVAVPNFWANLKSSIEESIGVSFDSKGFWKDFVLDKVAFTIAQKASDRMVRSVVTWANDGFKSVNADGEIVNAPLFVDDFGAYLQDIANDSTLGLLDDLSVSDSPFAQQLTMSIVSGYNETLTEQLRYTMHEVLGTEEGVFFETKGFSSGGWNAYIEQSEQGNNPIGAFLAVNEKQQQQLAKDLTTQRDQLVANKSFLNARECEPGEIKERDSDPDIKYCAKYAVTTPGSIVEGTLQKSLDLPLDQSTEVDTWGELLANSLVRLTDGLTQAGVKSLSTAISNSTNSLYAPNLVDVTATSEQVGGPDSDPSSGVYKLGNDVEVIDIRGTLWGKPDTLAELEEQTGITVGGGSGVSQQEALALIDDQDGLLPLLRREIRDLQEMTAIIQGLPPKIHRLDVCLPGPDTGWEQRLDDTFEQAAQKLFRKVNKSNPDEDKEDKYDQLTAGLVQLKQTMKLKMITAEDEETIANAFDYEQTILGARDYASQQTRLIDELTEKAALENALDNLWEDWIELDTDDEIGRTKILQQFKVLSSQFTFSDQTNDIETRLIGLKTYDDQLEDDVQFCLLERAVLYDNEPQLADQWVSSGGLNDAALTFPLDTLNNFMMISPLYLISVNQSVQEVNYRLDNIDSQDKELTTFCHNFITPDGAVEGEDYVNLANDNPTDNPNGLPTYSDYLSINPMLQLSESYSGKEYIGIACSQFYFSDITDYLSDNSTGFF